MSLVLTIITGHIYLHVIELLRILTQAIAASLQEMKVPIHVLFIFLWMSMLIVRLIWLHNINNMHAKCNCPLFRY